MNHKTQSGLWAYGISGDVPIVMARITNEKDMRMVRQLLHAHEYLRLKGLAIDLVLLNERAPSYLQMLQEELQRQIRMSGSQPLQDKPGGVFIRRSDIMPPKDILLLESVARVDLNSEKGTLEEQLKRRPVEEVLPGSLRSVQGETPGIGRHTSAAGDLGAGVFQRPGRVYQRWTPLCDRVEGRAVDAGSVD